MKKIIKLELKKTFVSRAFLFSALMGIAFVILSAIYVVSAFEGPNGTLEIIRAAKLNGNMQEIVVDGATLYNRWIGAETMSPGNALYFYLLPLISIIPGGFSLSYEMKTGYIKTIIPKCGRRNYIFAKLIAAFLSGGCIVALSLIFSVVIVAAYIPAIAPNVINDMYYPIWHGDILSSVAYKDPLLFIACYIFIDFIFGGLFACMPVMAAYIVKKPLVAVVGSYLIVLSSDLIRSFFTYICYIEVSPLKLMHAIPPLNASRPIVVMAWYIFFLIIVFPYSIYKGVKYEIL